MIHCVDV